MKSSDYIVSFLGDLGTEKVFAFTGGAISHIIDSFRNYRDQIDYICVQNEQVGAMAAEAYSRTTGKMGVTLGTSGPGATNMITGIAGAWYDCIPALYLVGQVRTWEMKGEDGLLQRGFQELDIVSSVAKITKYAVTITDAADIRYEFEKAMYMAREGRPGPVLIDLPMDMQWADIDPDELRSFDPSDLDDELPDLDMTEFAKALKKSKRPLVVCGGGVRHGKASGKLLNFLEKTGIPAITTYAGLDILPHDHQCNGGVMGQFGMFGANFVTGQADLILTLGARNSIKQVGNTPNEFAPQATKIAVNLDNGELVDGRVPMDICINADIGDFLDLASEIDYLSDNRWCSYVAEMREKHQEPWQVDETAGFVDPYHFITQLSKHLDDDAIVIPDVGQNVIYTCQAIRLSGRQRLFSSWGNSPMGFSMPAAIGAQTGNPDRQIVCIIGDGGLQVNIQDLQTIKAYNLPIKIFLFNNSCYATIHEFQDPNFEGRYEATDADHGYTHPDFSKVIEAFGLNYTRIESNDCAAGIAEVLAHEGSIICELPINSKFRVTGVLAGADPLHVPSREVGLVAFDQWKSGAE